MNLLMTLLLGIASLFNPEGIIGTHKGMILVYNYPDNYFYLELQGEELYTTDRENLFVIDNKYIQVITLHQSVILDGKHMENTRDLLTHFVQWEESYQQQEQGVEIQSVLEFWESPQGKEIVFWKYSLPERNPQGAKDPLMQLQVITQSKDYIVALNIPVFDLSRFDEIKEYLFSTIASLMEDQREIDLYLLDAMVNNR